MSKKQPLRGRKLAASLPPVRGRKKQAPPAADPATDPAIADVIWGAEGIARYIKRSRFQVYCLISTGVFDGVIQKIGHKSICASRKKLDQLLSGELGPPAKSAKAKSAEMGAGAE
jgi:hypothetical protein